MNRLAAQVKQKIASLVLRAVIRMVDDAGGIQLVQIQGLDGEDRSEVERIQNYGFTSSPPPDSEAVAIAVNGDRGHLLIVAADHRATRQTGLKPGESALYNGLTGKLVKLSVDGKVHLGGEVIVPEDRDPVIRRSDLETIFAAGTPSSGDGGLALQTAWKTASALAGSSVVFSE